MRKLFWGCTLGAVLAAAGVYLGASHASRHPDSFVARSMIVAYRGLVHPHPVYGFGQVVAGQTFETAPEPGGACAAVELRVGAEPSVCVPMDLSQCRLPGRIIINEEEEVRQTGTVVPAADFGSNFLEELPPIGAAVELIPAPRREYELSDVSTVAVPSVTVYPFDGYTLPAQSEEPEVLPPPAEDKAPAVMPPADDEAREPFTSIDEFFRKTAVVAEGPRGEPNEQPDYGQPPDCREDPHHYQLYPGCPQAGCPRSRDYCPYSGRRMATESAPDRLEKKSARPALPRPSADEGAEESEDRPRHPEVDTMEFRIDDAKPEEFGLIPF